MKKPIDKLKIARKRARKRTKRKRNRKKYNSNLYLKKQNLRVKYESKVIENYKSELFHFLLDKKFIVGTEDVSTKIKIGERFSLDYNYNETIKKISDIVYSIWINAGNSVEIDFSDCVYVDQSALFLLQILRFEFQAEFEKLGRRLSVLNPRIKVIFIESRNQKVNLHLFLCGLIDTVTLERKIEPIDSLGYLKGSKQQKSYLENKKGYFASKIVAYINRCLKLNGFELNMNGVNDINNLIGEVLNNAEDHSPFNTYYVTANYHQEKEGVVDFLTVGELNLSFLNFGYSIYEGLEDNKSENSETYNILNEEFNSFSSKFEGFSKENLFTLYALQDGISRLKFEDESRGTGTMKFIRCFFSIGDYQDVEKGKNPQLSILSGSTRLVCDKEHEPFEINNKFLMSLNKEKSLLLPPETSHLQTLKYSFPGTMLSVKVYLNSEHINKKLSEY